jgi:hypothetical protein
MIIALIMAVSLRLRPRIEIAAENLGIQIERLISTGE